jgi:hypothetical protein
MTTTTAPVTLDDVQLEAAVLLTKVDTSWSQVDLLTDTHQPGISFVPRSTREAIGRQYAAERTSRRAAQVAGYPAPLGGDHAPGNLAAWTLSAEIETTLMDVRARILKGHAARGTCAVPRRVYSKPTRRTLPAIVRELIWTIPTLVLARLVVRELTHLVEAIDRLLEGEDRTELDGRCPHCDGLTLVVYLHSGTIRCERPKNRATGRRPKCVCSDPLCGCHANPAGYIHSWSRDRRPGAPDSWQALSDRLNLTHLAHPKKEHR